MSDFDPIPTAQDLLIGGLRHSLDIATNSASERGATIGRMTIAYRALEKRVTEALQTAVLSGSLERSEAANIAREIGVDGPEGEFNVTVTITVNVFGVSAISEDAAIELVTDALDISCDIKRASVDFDIDDSNASED